MTHLLDYLADRVLLCDGAMGTQVQAPQSRDRARFPRATRTAPRSCARAGPTSSAKSTAAISRAGVRRGQTNSFGGSPITLGEFGIADKAFDLNRRAAELAHEAIAEVRA